MAGIDTSFYPQANPNALTQGVNLRGAQLGNQLLATQNQQATQNLAEQRIGFLRSGLGALAQKPDLSASDMLNFVNQSLQEGVISPQIHQTEMANIQAAGNDPDKLRALTHGYIAQTESAAEQYGATFGMPIGQRNMPNTFTNASGNPTTGTNQQIATHLTGQDPFAVGTGPANQLTGAPLAPPPANQQGAPTATATPPPATQPAAAPTGPFDPTKYYPNGAPSQATGMVAAPNAGQQAAIVASNAQFQQDKQMAAGYQANMLPAQQLTGLLKKTWTGPGTDGLNNLGQIAASFGIPWAGDQSANLSEIKKWANKLALSMPGAAGSDLRTLTSLDTVPGAEIDNKAAQNIAASIVSLGRMQEAQVRSAMDDPNVNGNNYTDYAATSNAKMDPRAFRLDIMSPADKAAIAKQISGGTPAAKAAAKNWNYSYDLANKYNLLNLPSPGVAGQQ